jgi:hypothetical protein
MFMVRNPQSLPTGPALLLLGVNADVKIARIADRKLPSGW